MKTKISTAVLMLLASLSSSWVIAQEDFNCTSPVCDNGNQCATTASYPVQCVCYSYPEGTPSRPWCGPLNYVNNGSGVFGNMVFSKETPSEPGYVFTPLERGRVFTVDKRN